MSLIPKTKQALNCGYEYTPLFYSTPCKVRFYDASIREFEYGVALFGYIARACDGELLLIEDIVQSAENDGVFWDDAVVELDWNSYQYNR